MKPKIIQLLLFFLMVSLFSSSKDNNKAAAITCKIKCVQPCESTLQGSDIKGTAAEDIAEYPLVLVPGNFMFRY